MLAVYQLWLSSYNYTIQWWIIIEILREGFTLTKILAQFQLMTKTKKEGGGGRYQLFLTYRNKFSL